MPNNLKLLTIIVDDNKKSQINKIIKKYNLFFNYTIPGYGSASSSLLEYFGLNEVKKQIYISVIPDKLQTEIMTKLNKSLAIQEIGTGICFTIPISSSVKYLQDVYETTSIYEEEQKMISNKKYHLIITITEEGYSEKVMNVAKKNGATGGTLIKGSGLGNKDAVKFLGFSIEPEKDIILIVANTTIKTKLMQEITKEVGLNTKGKGICFSLPIDQTMGLGEEIKLQKI